MHIFSYDFLKNRTVSSTIFSLSNIITDIKAKVELRAENNKELFRALETIAIKESVVGSCAIENIYTTEQRVTEILEKNSAPITHSEKEIVGYHKAIKFIKENYERLDFNEETIKLIHSFLVEGVSDESNIGKYKHEDNVIAEKYSNGSVKKVIFKPVNHNEVEIAMKNLCLAYQNAKSDYEIPSILLIPCVIVDFLSIHPFKDGNGRVSRLLTLLLLFKEGYNIGKYISFENQINIYKGTYYSALESSQYRWHESRNDYKEFIIFTFQILYQCYKEISKRMLLSKDSKLKKNERIEYIITDSLIPISKKDIANFLPDISITTIEAVLNKLLKENRIIMIGTGRETKYFKK